MSKRARLKFRLRFKVLINTLIQVTSLILFGWLHNKIIEMIMIYLCFFIFSKQFDKQSHAKTTWLCTLYTIIVQYIISWITPDVDVSVILIVVLTFTINFISFHMRNYNDLRKGKKSDDITISKKMSRRQLATLCNTSNLSELETNILIDFYCNNLKIETIAERYNYSYDSIWKIKKKALTKLKKGNKSLEMAINY